MSTPTVESFPEGPAFQRALLRWYSTHKRDLPWRKNHSPYRILVSEFMLQQTRVETVIPYFLRFLEQFPTIQHLARAPLHRVLKAWEGLGYYARSRHLHAAARIICHDLGAKIPRRKEDLLSLPGFGPYTAGAVASLAFNQSVAAPDGNVKRIVNRLFPGGTKPIPAKNGMEQFLEDLIPEGRASDFNQALMDLGALVCIPLRPRCEGCPVGKFCPSKGGVKERSRTAKKVRQETWAIALVEKDRRFLLHRNKDKGLLAELWQFPTLVVKRNGKTTGRFDPRRALRDFLQEGFGLKVKIHAPLPAQEYFFTHIHAMMLPYPCSVDESALTPSFFTPARWVKPSSFSRYPISTAMKKIAAQIRK